MSPNQESFVETPALNDVVAKIDEAGGFGDGADFGSFRALDALSEPGISDEGREAASLVLLCELAEAVDNSTWKDAVESSLGRRLRRLLSSGSGLTTHEDAMQAFFSSESEFFASLKGIFLQVIGGRGAQPAG
jgi:hypothetical protein